MTDYIGLRTLLILTLRFSIKGQKHIRHRGGVPPGDCIGPVSDLILGGVAIGLTYLTLRVSSVQKARVGS